MLKTWQNITIKNNLHSYIKFFKLSDNEFSYIDEIPRGSWFGLVNKHGLAH